MDDTSKVKNHEVNLYLALTLLIAMVSFSGYSQEAKTTALPNWVEGYITIPTDAPKSWSKSKLPYSTKPDPDKKLLVQKIILPEVEYKFPAIFFYRIYNNFEVRLDGKVIKSVGSLTNLKGDDFKGFPWYLVKLPDNYSGKELSIVSYSTGTRIGIRHIPVLGSIDYLLTDLIHEEFDTFISIGLNLGLIFMIIVAALNGIQTAGGWLLSLYTFFSTAFITSVSPLSFYIYDNPIFWSKVENYGLFLLTAFGFWSLREIIIRNPLSRIIMKWVVVVYALNFIFVILTNALDIIPYWGHVKRFNIMNISILLTLSILSLIKYLKGDKELRPVIISFVIVIASGVVESLVALGQFERNYFTYSYSNFMVMAVLITFGARQYFSIAKDFAQEKIRAKNTEIEHISNKEAAIKKLIGGVAHEFNNPLAIITAGMDLAPAIIHKKNAEHLLSRNFARMDKAIDRITKINKILLEFGTDVSLDETDFKASQLFSTLQDNFEHELVTFKVETDLIGIHLNGDLKQITEALTSIINNALDANQAMNHKKNVAARFKLLNQKFVIDIEDFGAGISSQQFPHLFNPFYTTKEVGKGIGLNLFVANQIIQASNGSIDIIHRHEPTVFRITFSTAY